MRGEEECRKKNERQICLSVIVLSFSCRVSKIHQKLKCSDESYNKKIFSQTVIISLAKSSTKDKREKKKESMQTFFCKEMISYVECVVIGGGHWKQERNLPGDSYHSFVV